MELKANTPTSRSVVAADPYDADMSMDIGDVSTMSTDSADVFGGLLSARHDHELSYGFGFRTIRGHNSF